jgi:hypothetical protein
MHMIPTRLSVVLALFSMLSTSAIAAEQFTAEQEQAKLLQLQGVQQEGDVGTQDVTKQIWPQRTEEFPTWWFVRTDWKVYNPNAESVLVNVRCNRYGYDYWYWIAPYATVTDRWGCEGQPLYIFNNAPSGTGLYVQATTW